MDSLTQIVLGAACGEAALGKKIGNKALLFGAIGGTIPDLDVFLGHLFYGNKIDAFLFHRGFMHSIFFAILGAFLFGWLVYKLYDKGKRRGTTTRKDWIWLFFLSIFTHPLLDCFTGYGTQLFLPFSDYRSVYMLCTIGNKFYINSVFEKSMEEQGISYQRYNTEASILNNILWYGIAETEDEYHVAFYSLFDTKDVFTDWKTIPKNHDLLPRTYSDLANLAWFSNYYYTIKENEDGTFIYSDLRYPSVDTGKGESAVFYFTVYKDGDRLNMKRSRPSFDENTSFSDVLGIFWKRIKGK